MLVVQEHKDRRQSLLSGNSKSCGIKIWWHFGRFIYKIPGQDRGWNDPFGGWFESWRMIKNFPDEYGRGEKEDIPEKGCNMITNKSLGHVSSFEDWLQSWGQELWWMTSQDAGADSGPSWVWTSIPETEQDFKQKSWLHDHTCGLERTIWNSRWCVGGWTELTILVLVRVDEGLNQGKDIRNRKKHTQRDVK